MVKEMDGSDKGVSSSTPIKASEIPRDSATGNPFYTLFLYFICLVAKKVEENIERKTCSLIRG